MGNIEISRNIFPAGTRGKDFLIFNHNLPSSNHAMMLPQEGALFTADISQWPPQNLPCANHSCVFISTIGVNMEMLGRRALWEVGLNYGHGTGHGVGNYFGVHECKSGSLTCLNIYLSNLVL